VTRFSFGGDAIPREQRDRIDALANQFEKLRVAQGERLDRYKTYRNENEAARALTDVGRTYDYGQQKEKGDGRHAIALPFGMALTVKHAYRIAGRLPDAMVDRREETPQEHYRSDTMEKMWWGIVRESAGETQFATGAWDGSQLGASCFEVYFDLARQIPIVRAVDPAGVVVVKGIDDPHSFQRVYRFWDVPVLELQAEYGDAEVMGASVSTSDIQSTHKTGGVDMATVVQACDRNTCVRFALGAKAKLGPKSNTPLWQWDHGLGFVPYVVIPNIGPERDVWGWADYEFVRSLVAYLPQLLSREADILKMVANGAFIEKGTGQSPQTVKDAVKKGGILPSRRDGSVEPIQAPEVPSFQESHAARAIDFFKMLGFAPDAAWGGADTRSGADRTLQLQPLVEYTAMKQTNWVNGLSRIGRMCFRMIESLQVLDATYRGARTSTRSGQRTAFAPFKIGPNVPPVTLGGQPPAPTGDPMLDDPGLQGLMTTEHEGAEVTVPATPADLFDGDYNIRFAWQNRIDPDDPAYVLSELNKFSQAAQSLRTTLEHLGIQAPEDEMKLIEDEAERFPWLRQGMIALIQNQLQAENGQQGGSQTPAGQTADLAGGLQMTQTKDGTALNNDAGAAALGAVGQLYGGA